MARVDPSPAAVMAAHSTAMLTSGSLQGAAGRAHRLPQNPIGGASRWENNMRIEKGLMVALGYGKYVRSDRVVALEPIAEGRGPGQRTNVYVEDLEMPLVASRSEVAIMRD